MNRSISGLDPATTSILPIAEVDDNDEVARLYCELFYEHLMLNIIILPTIQLTLKADGSLVETEVPAAFHDHNQEFGL